MSKLYYKIQKQLLKELKENNQDQQAQSNQQPPNPVITMANNKQFISPIIAELKKYIKKMSKKPAHWLRRVIYWLSSENPRAKEIEKSLITKQPSTLNFIKSFLVNWSRRYFCHLIAQYITD